MADSPDNVIFDSSSSSGNGGGDPYQLAQWINGAKTRVASGLSLDNSGQWDPARGKYGLPLGYQVKDGQLQQDTRLFSSIYKGLLGTAGMATLGLLVGPTMATAPTLEATMNADAAATAGPLAGAETGLAPTTAALTPPASIAAPTASSAPSWLVPAIKAAAPTAAELIARNASGGGGGTSGFGLSPDQTAMVNQLLALMVQRQTDAAPLHAAAMKLAGGLAPTRSWADSPQFQQAVQATTGPGPASQTTPAIRAMAQNLMSK